MKTITNNLDHVVDRVRSGDVAAADALSELQATWASQEKHVRAQELRVAVAMFEADVASIKANLSARIALILGSPQ